MMRRAARTRSQVTTRRLLCGGAVAGPLFITTFLLEGATRVGYDALRHPVSSLALGPGGRVQTANFVVAGVLYGAGATGLWRAHRPPAGTSIGPVLIGAAAAGLVGAGVFTTDPVSGYPPGTSDALPGYSSAAAALHDMFAVPTFLGIPAAALVYARWFHRNGERRWAAYSAESALLMLGAVVLASAAFNQAPALVDYGGLLQRVSVTTGFAWLTALALHALPRHAPGPAHVRLT
jgi:hypothetical protein